MPDRLIELAIEALESRKAAIDAEIAALRKGLRPARFTSGSHACPSPPARL